MNLEPLRAAFLALSPADQQIQLYLLRDQRRELLNIHEALGIRDCPVDCQPRRLPCPLHSFWLALARQGLSPTEIALRSPQRFGRFKAKQVKRWLKRPDPLDCDCPAWIAPYEPCPHLAAVNQDSPLTRPVLAMLYWLLDMDPPSPREPLLLTSRRAKARAMAQRTGPDGLACRPMRPDDLPSKLPAPLFESITLPQE